MTDPAKADLIPARKPNPRHFIKHRLTSFHHARRVPVRAHCVGVGIGCGVEVVSGDSNQLGAGGGAFRNAGRITFGGGTGSAGRTTSGLDAHPVASKVTLRSPLSVSKRVLVFCIVNPCSFA